MWIFTLAKLLYKVLVPFTSILAKLLYKVPLPFTSTLAKHLHIPIKSHIFQCQCAIGCYLVFQITIGGREIPTRGNTIPDCGGSGTFVWTSPTLCTMISCNSERLLLIASHSHYHNKTCTNMSVQWPKKKKKKERIIWWYSVGPGITCYSWRKSWLPQRTNNSLRRNVTMSSTTRTTYQSECLCGMCVMSRLSQ